MVSRQPAQAPASPPTADPLALVAEALARLRFGDIRLTVHEGRLVQIDVTEKTRLPHS
jgi:hypothetical protein